MQCYLLCPADSRGLSFLSVLGTFTAGLEACSQSEHNLHEFKAMVQPWPGCIQVIWVIWDVISLRQDVKPPLCQVKASPQLPVSGKPPPWADNSIPVFKSQGLAHWTLDWSDVTTPVLFSSLDPPARDGAGWRSQQFVTPKPWCLGHNFGANLDQGSAGSFAAGNPCWERQTGPRIEPCADPTLANTSVRLFFEGYVALFTSNFLLLPNFSERSRGNKLRKY